MENRIETPYKVEGECHTGHGDCIMILHDIQEEYRSQLEKQLKYCPNCGSEVMHIKKNDMRQKTILKNGSQNSPKL